MGLGTTPGSIYNGLTLFPGIWLGIASPSSKQACVLHLCIFINKAISKDRLKSELAMNVASEQRETYLELNLQHVIFGNT